jgi:phage-related protein
VVAVHFIASSRDDLLTFPEAVRKEVGFALHQAQCGEKALHALPLVGFNGAGVLEIVSDEDGNTYRTVYTVKLSEAVFVLHCFKKKSKSGRATPKKDMDLVRSRLKVAEQENERLKRVKLLEIDDDNSLKGRRRD